jgi:SIR2-like domain
VERSAQAIACHAPCVCQKVSLYPAAGPRPLRASIQVRYDDVAQIGAVLGPKLGPLADELADQYVRGNLLVVAGAGVSRASGLPGWAEMVATIEAKAAADLANRLSPTDLGKVLDKLHREDPISRADSLKRLMTAPMFFKRLHEALYPPLPEGQAFQPSVSHWHIASLVDHALMPNLYTSNYDDLLEDAKQALGRSGRVRHFHGRLPQRWSGSSRLGDPPVVTSRDYMAAEDQDRYEPIAREMRDKTVLLVGFSLSDPNLARVIHDQARDCRAILVASQGDLTDAQQVVRLDLLRRYWSGLNIGVTAIGAREELPAFLLALRGRVLEKQGRSLATDGALALKVAAANNPWLWVGARQWRDRLRVAVVAGKEVAETIRGDGSLRAGLYAIKSDGFLEHLVGSATTRSSYGWARRNLKAADPRPWGAAGYSFAAGVPISSAASGPAFDRNVPDGDLLQWQSERAEQGRLPAASVLCVPAWVKFRREVVAVGVLYFSSRRGAAFDDPRAAERLKSVLELTFEGMIKPERAVRDGSG